MRNYPDPSLANDPLRDAVVSDVFEVPIAPYFVSQAPRIEAGLRGVDFEFLIGGIVVDEGLLGAVG